MGTMTVGDPWAWGRGALTGQTMPYPAYPVTTTYPPTMAPLPPIARPTDPKLLEVLERIADALEDMVS